MKRLNLYLTNDRPFDVLVFARSLHHLSPLSEAVEQAHRLSAPGGRVIVEDFAWAVVLSNIEDS